MVDVEQAAQMLGLVLQAAREEPGARDRHRRTPLVGAAYRRLRSPVQLVDGPGTDRQPSSAVTCSPDVVNTGLTMSDEVIE